MVASWRRLQEYLVGCPEVVRLTWEELDHIVGGMPASAVDHYPQWWHGDRSHTRAWRAAGYEAEQIHPGKSVVFRRTAARAAQAQTFPAAREHERKPAVDGVAVLREVDPENALLIVPCAARKHRGGAVAAESHHGSDWLSAARRTVLAKAELDDTRLMPAWQRYDGEFYRAAGPGLEAAAQAGRLVILSGDTACLTEWNRSGFTQEP